MDKNVVITVLVMALLGVGIFAFMNRNAANNQPTDTTVVVEDDNTPAGQNGDSITQNNQDATTREAETENTMTEENVKEFEVAGTDFKFNPDSMTVNKGDTVRVVFTNTDESMPHDWVIDEFNARTKQLQPGQSETIEFVADQSGEFEFYCSVGNHRAQGMVGTLTVNE